MRNKRHKINIRNVFIVTLMTMFLITSINTVSAYVTQEDPRIEYATAWAETKIGSNEYAQYWCLKFALDTYRIGASAAITGVYPDAKTAANMLNANQNRDNPPRGALVFYDWYGTINGVYKNWGHVGLSLGDGNIIHAAGGPVKKSRYNNMGSAYTFIGWAYPPLTQPLIMKIPITGDMNRDGVDTNGIFDRITNTFTIDGKSVVFGIRGDLPVMGDWDKDGKDEIGLFRRNDGTGTAYFYLTTKDWDSLPNGGNAGNANYKVNFGIYGFDIPLVGDWDGDEDDDIGGFNSVPGIYQNHFFLYTLANAPPTSGSDILLQSTVLKDDLAFGIAKDRPITGDWDGDRDDDIGVYRDTSFYLDLGLTGDQGELPVQQHGVQGDMPITGDWTPSDGDDNIGVYHPLSSTYPFDTDANKPPDQSNNRPPNTPNSPSPTNGATNQPTSPTLSWSGGDPDGDTVTYTTYLDTSSSPTTQRCADTPTSCPISGLSYSTTYYWKVVANDGKTSPVTGPVWSFTTGAQQSNGVLGIDVSHWQENINWASVHNAGYKFAFAKSTEGTGFTDSYFTTNMINGKANGMLIGAYHFARPELNSATAEANYFVSITRPYLTNGYLRPALDIETGSNIGKAALSNWINTFINTVKSQTGVEPIVYMNSNYATNYVDSSVTGRSLWIAHWRCNVNTPPSTGVWSNWDFWQYYSPGSCGVNSVPGISGGVDIDKFNGDISRLNSFMIQAQQNPTLSLSPLTGPQGQSFHFTGSGYTANKLADWHIKRSDGTEITPGPAPSTADGSGNIVRDWTSSCSDNVDAYTIWTVDRDSGRQSNSVTQTITASPSCTPTSNTIFVQGTDGALWYRTLNTGWIGLGGIITSDPDATYLNGNTYVFAKGGDGALWYRTLNTGWVSLGGAITSSPGVTSLNGDIYIFVRGTDNALWYRTLNTGWNNLGGNLNSGPGVATLNDDIHIFVEGTDEALWHRTFNTGWNSLGGNIIDDPDAASLNGNVYVFARGGNDALQYRTLNTGWSSLGGSLISPPGVSSWNSDVYTFVRGTDNALWYRTLNSGWSSLGGVINSGPGAS